MIDITLAKHEDMYEVADLVIGAFGTETCVKIPALGDPKTASKMMFIERYLDFINKKNRFLNEGGVSISVSYTHLRAQETEADLE